MLGPEFGRLLLRPLRATGVPYMVTGGLAAIIYGDPRLTNDVDLVVRLTPQDAERLAAAYPAAEYYVPPIEVLREEASRDAHGHFNILHLESALRADVYCLGIQDALGEWGMTHRHLMMIGDDEVAVAPIEYVITMKSQYFTLGGSDRHLRDIRAMLRLDNAPIDRAVLAQWIERLGLGTAWRKVQDEA